LNTMPHAAGGRIAKRNSAPPRKDGTWAGYMANWSGTSQRPRMPRLKKNVGPLLDRSIESLTLVIEIFNRPSEIARTHAVLILLQHSFELLLKALILEKTGCVREPDGRFATHLLAASL
jgi:hypothetical protein